jgi:hypothetical protein
MKTGARLDKPPPRIPTDPEFIQRRDELFEKIQQLPVDSEERKKLEQELDQLLETKP